MGFTTDRLGRLQRSLEVALNQEWPQLSAAQKSLSKLRPAVTPIAPAKQSPLAVVATVATDGGENRLSLAPIQVQVIRAGIVKMCQLRDVVNVVTLRFGSEIPQLHIFDHAFA